MKQRALNRRTAVAIAGFAVVVLTLPVWIERISVGVGFPLFPLASGLLGGLALFLYGMEQASDALQTIAGASMRRILDRLSTNQFTALLTGVVVTAILQSSSVTTVMLVSFISAGLMTFSQSIGIILGANIGATITVQIIAFKVTQYALLLIALGFGFYFVANGRKRVYGHWLMSLGLLFLGLKLMGDVMSPLRDYGPFLDLMAAISNPIYSLLAAALFTALIQTSAATIGITIVFAAQGLVDLETGMALILGANVGTTGTAALAAIGKPTDAVRAAVAHILFKGLGALLVLPFIPHLAEFVVAISPRAGETGSLSTVLPRQIANAHTLFNVAIALFFLPFSHLLIRLVTWLVPSQDGAMVDVRSRPRYLDESLIDTPALALGMVRREVNRMGDVLDQMLAGVPEAVFEGNLEKMDEVRAMDEEVDAIFAATTRYLARVGQEHLPEKVADEILAAMTALTELEAIGDIIENNLTHLARSRVQNQIQLDASSLELLSVYHSRVAKALRSSLVAFVSDSREVAALVMDMKEEINQMDIQTRAWHARMLQKTLSSSDLECYTLQMDIMDNLKRIYYHVKRVAKLVVYEEGAADWAREQLIPTATG